MFYRLVWLEWYTIYQVTSKIIFLRHHDKLFQFFCEKHLAVPTPYILTILFHVISILVYIIPQTFTKVSLVFIPGRPLIISNVTVVPNDQCKSFLAVKEKPRCFNANLFSLSPQSTTLRSSRVNTNGWFPAHLMSHWPRLLQSANSIFFFFGVLLWLYCVQGLPIVVCGKCKHFCVTSIAWELA